jgi:hypothetical protein
MIPIVVCMDISPGFSTRENVIGCVPVASTVYAYGLPASASVTGVEVICGSGLWARRMCNGRKHARTTRKERTGRCGLLGERCMRLSSNRFYTKKIERIIRVKGQKINICLLLSGYRNPDD